MTFVIGVKRSKGMATIKVKIGDRFDKLEVIERAEDVYSKVKKRDKEGNVYYEQGTTKYKTWLCRCDCGKEVVVKQNNLTKEKAYLRSCGHCPQTENPNHTPPNMTKEEKKEWDALYEYVRTNIMGYDKNQSLPRDVVARLKGLLTGNYKANRHIKKNADYSYATILNTFKFCSPDIQKALRNNSFRDEQHKFNYITKIVERNINTVYLRMKKAEQTKKEVERDDMARVLDYVNTFKAEEDTPNKSNLYEDLW